MQAASPGELEADADFGAGAIAESGSSIGARKVDELRLTRVPLGAVLEYICDKTRLRYKIDKHAVILLPVASLELTISTREPLPCRLILFPVYRKMVAQAAEVMMIPLVMMMVALSALASGPMQKHCYRISGVSFPGESFANYIASTSTLVVHNTLNNLDIIDEIIAVLRKDGPSPSAHHDKVHRSVPRQYR